MGFSLKLRQIFIPGAWMAAGVFICLSLTGCSDNSELVRGLDGEKKSVALSELSKKEGSDSDLAPEPEPEKLSEGSGKKMVDHPQVVEDEVIERGVFVPEGVKGKWKAVKILIRDKRNEENNEIKTIELGSSFELADAGLRVTVGPFFPNFVMDKNVYSSMDNSLINPAVQLVVEKNKNFFYKGWAFKRFPSLYAFEHDVYGLELLESIPAEVS